MMDSPELEFSLLLWILGAWVATQAFHLSAGWVRQARHAAGLLGRWRALAVAAAVLGTGLSAATVLCMQAQALGFPVGYRAPAVLALWLAGALASLPLLALAAHSPRALVLVAAGTLLAALAAGLEMGWVWAAGFRPGVQWPQDQVLAAAGMAAAGLSWAQWLAFSAAGKHRRWRFAAAGLAGLSLMACLQLLSDAADLQTQRGSLFHDALTGGTELSLVCGVLVPLVLAGMSLDLWLRRGHGGPHDEQGPNPPKRRRRRYRHRAL